MKKASNIRLSLRKLLIATLAVGPLAVLPAPVWAAVPAAAPYTVTSGTATWSTSGAAGTVQATDKAVLVWNAGTFNIAVGETFNFTLPTGGAILNKVGYTTAGGLAAVDTATIDGTLFSTGKVFILANGNINIGGTAAITTNGGLFLSTLQETSDFSFSTVGSLSGTGASTGTITIGAAGASPSISGLLDASAGTIVSHRAAVTGDVIYRAVTAASGIDLAQSGLLAVGGNLTVTTNAGAITGTSAITVGGQVTGNQTATLSTGVTTGAGVNVTLGNAANDFEIVSVNAVGTAANVTLADANIITLGASTVGQDLTVTAVGTAGTVGIQNSGTVTIGRDASFTVTTNNSGVSVSNNSTIGRNLAGSALNAPFTFNGSGNVTIGTVGALNGIQITPLAGAGGNRSSVSVTAGNGTLTVTQPVTTSGNGTSGGGITLTGGTIATTGAGSVTQSTATGSTVTLNATTGGISIGAGVTGDKLTIRTAGGAITQTLAGVLSTPNSGTNIQPVANVFNAGTGTITLNTAPNTLAAGSVAQFTGSTASLSNAGALWLGTSNVTGAVNLTTTTAGQGIQLGAGLGTAGQAINIGGLLTVTTNGGPVTDENYGVQRVFGGLTINTTGGTVTLDAARANGGLAPRVEYGAVSINSGAGAIDITETTTLNLGAITTTGGLTARSTTGGVVDSGAFNVNNALFVLSNAAESVVIDNAGQNIGIVNVQGGTNHSILVGSASTLGGSTSVTGNLTFASAAGVGVTVGATSVTGNLTVNSGGAITVGGAVSVSGNLSLAAADAGASSIIDNPGSSIAVTNVTTLASSGNITLDSTGNDFSSVVFNGVTGNSRVDDANNISVSGTSSALVDVRSGANSGIGGAFNVVLGNLTVGSLAVTAQDGTGGTGGGISGTITQASGTKIHSEGAASFTTDGSNIVINNTGNNFGRVNASAGNAGITLRESGTIKLGAFSNNGTASTITSETGSIIEDSAIGSAATSYSTTNATLTLNAPAGSIQLGRATNVTGGPTTVGASTRIAASAPSGSVQLFSSTANLVVDTVNANSFSLIATGTGNLTQVGSGIKSFGPASFTTGGNMTMTNAGNNFGRVSITSTSASKNITITEGGTLNLGTVAMPGGTSGNFTATSTNGDIIDSGLGGVKLGGVAGGTPAPGTGIVSLIANNGNIILDDPTTDFATTGGVVFRGGNVTLSALGQTTVWLGAADQPSTAGNLTVTSAIGNIANSGNLTVTGNAFFQAGAGNVAINQTANQFGSIRFVGNQVSIAQTNNMNIQTGSSAIGQAQLASTGGNVTIVNAGGGAVSFGNVVSISASGSITLPKLLQAVGTLTVTAAGTKDLSALSITTDLSNKTPVNLGTGTYLPPQP